MFFIAFGCVKQDLNNYNDEKGLNADTRAWVQSANTPNLKRASLAENDKAILDKHLSKYSAFTIDEREIAGFFRGGSGSIRLPISEELDWTIRLELNDLRDPDYVATYTNDEGTFEVTEPFVVNTFKGVTSTGQPVRFTIDENTLFGVIFGENYHYTIMPAKDYTQNKGDNSYIVYKSWDVIRDNNCSDCVNDVLETQIDYVNNALALANGDKENLTIQGRPMTRVGTKILKVATDADYDVHRDYGNSTNSTIMTWINAIDGVYESTFGLNFLVTSQHVWDSMPSGYPYTSSDSDAFLESFRNYWNSNYQSVNRNIAILYTNKLFPKGGGKNYVGKSYTGNINGNTANNKAYSFVTMAGSFQTTAHEIGHLLNANDNPSDGTCGTIWGSIMCQEDKTLWFSGQSISSISSFLNSNLHYAWLNGPANIYYPGTVTTYNLVNPPSGTITWEISAGSPFTISPTTGSTTYLTQTTGTGSGTLSARVNTGVENKIVASRVIAATTTPVNGPMTGPSTVYAGQTYVYYNLQSVPGLTYTWASANGILTLASGNGYSEGIFNVPSNASGLDDTVYCTIKAGSNTIGSFYKYIVIY